MQSSRVFRADVVGCSPLKGQCWQILLLSFLGKINETHHQQAGSHYHRICSACGPCKQYSFLSIAPLGIHSTNRMMMSAACVAVHARYESAGSLACTHHSPYQVAPHGSHAAEQLGPDGVAKLPVHCQLSRALCQVGSLWSIASRKWQRRDPAAATCVRKGDKYDMQIHHKFI
jgi:hypothetical protein